jgi:hypothetical protein
MWRIYSVVPSNNVRHNTKQIHPTYSDIEGIKTVAYFRWITLIKRAVRTIHVAQIK